jgi:hypothetical protein
MQTDNLTRGPGVSLSEVVLGGNMTMIIASAGGHQEDDFFFLSSDSLFFFHSLLINYYSTKKGYRDLPVGSSFMLFLHVRSPSQR